MSVPMKKTDPAYWMLEQGLNDPSKRSTTEVFDKNCYICRDPEFALMGLPLCYACPFCTGQDGDEPRGHVPADDTVCTECGEDVQEEMMRRFEQAAAATREREGYNE